MKEIILRIIYEAIDETNKTLGSDQKIEKCLDTRLSGAGVHLDSIVLIGMIELVERKIEEFYQCEMILAVDPILQMSNNPFATIGSFAGFVESIVDNKNKKTLTTYSL